jgi:hypothetical protein
MHFFHLEKDIIQHVFGFFSSKDIACYSLVCKTTKSQVDAIVEELDKKSRDELIKMALGQRESRSIESIVIFNAKKIINKIGLSGWKYIAKQNVDNAERIFNSPILFSLLIKDNKFNELLIGNDHVANLLKEKFHDKLPESIQRTLSKHLELMNSIRLC